MHMLKNIGEDVNIKKKQKLIFAKYFKINNYVTVRVWFSKLRTY